MMSTSALAIRVRTWRNARVAVSTSQLAHIVAPVCLALPMACACIVRVVLEAAVAAVAVVVVRVALAARKTLTATRPLGRSVTPARILVSQEAVAVLGAVCKLAAAAVRVALAARPMLTATRPLGRSVITTITPVTTKSSATSWRVRAV